MALADIGIASEQTDQPSRSRALEWRFGFFVSLNEHFEAAAECMLLYPLEYRSDVLCVRQSARVQLPCLLD